MKNTCPQLVLALVSLTLLVDSGGAQQLLWSGPAGEIAPASDLDNDGLNDVQIGFDVLSGVDGSLLVDTFVSTPAGYLAGVPVSDVDGDGVPDVAFALWLFTQPDPPMLVFSGQTKTCIGGANPSGFFSDIDRITWITGREDVNGDGVADMVFGSAFTTILGDSGYGYVSGAALVPGTVTGVASTFWDSVPKVEAVVADFDGDSVADASFAELISPQGASTFYTTLSYADGLTSLGGFGFVELLGAADVDGDGTRDGLTVANGLVEGPITVKEVGSAATKLIVSGAFSAAAGVGDVDCDGLEDFLASSSAANMTTLHSGADGSILWQTPGFASELGPVGDVNGDGVGDFAVGINGTQVYAGPAPPVTTYCTGKLNSAGCTPNMDTTGLPTAQGPDNFLISARNVLVGKPGLLFWGTSGPAAIPFFNATLCVQPPLQRGPILQSTGVSDCNAGYAFFFSQSFATQLGIIPGTTLNAQFWMRDPAQADGTGVGLSNGVQFAWCE